MIYKIRLANCAFFARHGVHDEEETLGQRFYVDAELVVDPGQALQQDSIEGTVNYGVAFKVIETIITGHRRFLIEAIALECGNALLEAFPQILSARVVVRKPNAPVAGVLDHVEVEVDVARRP